MTLAAQKMHDSGYSDIELFCRLVKPHVFTLAFFAAADNLHFIVEKTIPSHNNTTVLCLVVKMFLLVEHNWIYALQLST